MPTDPPNWSTVRMSINCQPSCVQTSILTARVEELHSLTAMEELDTGEHRGGVEGGAGDAGGHAVLQ